MYVAVLNTGSFEFVGLGESMWHAKSTIAHAWLTHRRQYPDAAPWAEVEDGVNVVALTVGQAARDFARIG